MAACCSANSGRFSTAIASSSGSGIGSGTAAEGTARSSTGCSRGSGGRSSNSASRADDVKTSPSTCRKTPGDAIIGDGPIHIGEPTLPGFGIGLEQADDVVGVGQVSARRQPGDLRRGPSPDRRNRPGAACRFRLALGERSATHDCRLSRVLKVASEMLSRQSTPGMVTEPAPTAWRRRPGRASCDPP